MDSSKKVYILIVILFLVVLSLFLIWLFTKKESSPIEEGVTVFHCSDPITYQGDVYNTVEINGQCWLLENLKATSYRDGTAISNLVDSAEWREDSQGAYACYYNQEKNCQDYGALYNWHTVNSEKGICPEGWSVPTDEQWAKISTDELGLLFGGFRNAGGPFSYLNEKGFWWTSTSLEGSSFARTIDKENQAIRKIESNKLGGFSVRCIKDQNR